MNQMTDIKPLIQDGSMNPTTPIKLLKMKDFESNQDVRWCPGCGDFSVLHAAYKALNILGYDPKDTVVVSGIGCSGRFPIFTTCYGFHGVHGRSLAAAIKYAQILSAPLPPVRPVLPLSSRPIQVTVSRSPEKPANQESRPSLVGRPAAVTGIGPRRQPRTCEG